jgi:flagellum-specific ATP synthase
LDRAIADEGRYPAVNILSSISRLAHPVWTPEQRKLVTNLRSLIARYEETRELRLMGGYAAGADSILDKAIKSVPRICEAMNQSIEAPACEDPFIELAAALRSDAKTAES